MRIGAIAYQPYIYNTNRVSAASLDRVNALPEDGTKGGVDYSPLADDGKNMNPLKKGQSSNFSDIFSSQMAKSRSKSMALMKSSVRQKADDADSEAQAVQDEKQQKAGAGPVADEERSGSQVSYRMRQALDAYSAAMGIVA